jgi:crossover junction endodeoxyribonuclease RuvC
MLTIESRIILGIDVGIATTGWSVIQKLETSKIPKLIACGAIITKPDRSPEERLKSIYTNLNQIILDYKPGVCAVESLFFFKNQKTVIGVGQARGVILLAASMANLEVYNYTPLQVKISVSGYGRAEKKQVQKMVQNIYALKEIPKPDDIADAIAVATCHLYSFKSNKNDSSN